MKKFIALLLPFTFFLSTLKAQQLPLYSQYMLNDFSMNPAIAGIQPVFNLKSDSRFQWIGITDAPRTYVLTFDGPITSQHIGIGAYVFTDITGPTRRTGFTSAYSYHLKLNDNLNLSMGLSAGIMQFAVDGQSIALEETSDKALANTFMSVLVPDFAAGVYLYSDHYYFGVAAPQIIGYHAKLTALADAGDELVTHYYATAGYRFDANDIISIEPCIVAKYVNPVPPQFDMGMRIFYQKKFWLGGGYRTQDAAYAMIGYTYQQNLSLGFSYDFPVTDIHKYSVGTTEFFIGIKFNKPKADKPEAATPSE